MEPALFIESAPRNLRRWVSRIWYSRGVLEKSLERVLPTARTDIVINLGAPMLRADAGEEQKILGTTVTGLLSKPFTLRHPRVHEALGIILTPVGFRAVLGIPSSAASDLIVTLQDALELEHDILVQRCAVATSPEECIATTITWLRERICIHADSIDPIAAWAAARIESSRGNLAIASLQQESGYGATRFHQRFVDEFGVSPKTYARLVRFQTALENLSPACPLTDLALSLGYTDQAHMNRDFRTLGQTTPLDVLRSSYVNGTTLAVE